MISLKTLTSSQGVSSAVINRLQYGIAYNGKFGKLRKIVSKLHQRHVLIAFM